MSTDQPYNSLGQILAEGGEIALGLAILRNWNSDQIAALFQRKFEPMRPEDRIRLTQLAQAAIAGAESSQNTPFGSPISLTDLPVNPELFGDDFSGKRSFYLTEVWNPFKDHWIEIRLEFAGVPTPEEIQDKMFAEARRRLNDSPEKLGKPKDAEIPPLQGRVLFQERRF